MAQERKRWKVLMLGSRECDCAEQISRVLAHHAVVDVADSMADATRLLGAGTGSTPGGKVSAAGRIPRPDATSGSGYDAFLRDWNFAGGGWQGAYEKFGNHVSKYAKATYSLSSLYLCWISSLVGVRFSLC